MKYYALVVAGGSGSRMGSAIPKQFLSLAGKPLLMHTLTAFQTAFPDISLLLVLPTNQQNYWQDLCSEHNFTLAHQIIAGGNSRFQSVKAGLEKIEKPEESLVAVHDGVRPLITPELIRQAYRQAAKDGSAILAVPLKDSIRFEHTSGQTEAKDRSNYWIIQTPQAFQAATICAAYAQKELPIFTDCASVAEAAGFSVKLMEGSYRNIKVTTPEDLKIAEVLLQST